MKQILLSIFILFIHCTTQAYKFEHYEDIAFDNATVIAMDNNGFVWCASKNRELIKFDGTKWNVIKQFNHTIKVMKFDLNNNLYLGVLNEGLYKFNGSKLELIKQPSYPDAFNFISCIQFQNNNEVWIGTNGAGLFQFDGNNWSHYPFFINNVSASIFDIEKDLQGNLLFSTGIWGTPMPIYTASGVWDTLPNSSIINGSYDIAIDNIGNIWGSKYTILKRYSNMVAQDFYIPFPLSNIKNLQIDAQQHLWFSSKNKLIEINGNLINTFHNQYDTTLYNQTNMILVGINNAVWSLNKNGISVLNNTNLTEYLNENFGPRFYAQIATSDDGKVAVCKSLSNGIDYFESQILIYNEQQKSWDSIISPDFKSLGSGDMIYDKYNVLWIIKQSGGEIFKYWNGNWSKETALNSHQNYKFTLDANGEVAVIGRNSIAYQVSGQWQFLSLVHTLGTQFFGGFMIDKTGKFYYTNYELYIYDGNNWQTHSTFSTGLNANFKSTDFGDIVEGKNGHVFISSFENGVFEFDGQNWTLHDTTNHSILTNYNFSIAIDKDSNLICGSVGTTLDGGIAKYDGVTWSGHAYSSTPLCGNSVWEIKVDSKNNIWCLDGGGLTKISAYPLSTQNQTSNLNINISPNPAQTSLSINGYKSEYHLELFDVIGNQQKLKYEKSNGVLNISHLMNGIYLLKVTNEKETQTLKFIKN